MVPMLISIHALREEGDQRLQSMVEDLPEISIHALREEGDLNSARMAVRHKLFLSTPSARRATWRALTFALPRRYFYPRPPRGGRHFFHGHITCRDLISIHALREEGDIATSQPFLITYCISIHALREEGDLTTRWRKPVRG